MSNDPKLRECPKCKDEGFIIRASKAYYPNEATSDCPLKCEAQKKLRAWIDKRSERKNKHKGSDFHQGLIDEVFKLSVENDDLNAKTEEIRKQNDALRAENNELKKKLEKARGALTVGLDFIAQLKDQVKVLPGEVDTFEDAARLALEETK